MKHPAAAAGVLALHLLGLWALVAARPPAAASDHTVAQRMGNPAVLLVKLRGEPAPAARRPVALPQPEARGTRAADVRQSPKPAPLPARTPAPALALAASPLTTAALDAVSETASAPAAAIASASASATPPSPPPSPLPGARATTAATTEPTLTLAHADRHDCPQAPHPAALRERGIEGEVHLLVRVGTDGRAAEVRLQQPSGWRLFDHAALAQALACRFVPARRGVQAVESWVEFPVRFSLRG